MYLKPVASVLRRAVRCAYTLVEVLIATTLALMLMAAVGAMFGQLGNSVNNSRATLEMSEKLRAAAERLRMDLGGLTVTTLPPRRVENNDGYFEIHRTRPVPASATGQRSHGARLGHSHGAHSLGHGQRHDRQQLCAAIPRAQTPPTIRSRRMARWARRATC